MDLVNVMHTTGIPQVILSTGQKTGKKEENDRVS